jgi:hypothetical protein
MEVARSTETSVLTRAARHHIPDDGILRSHCPVKSSNLTLLMIMQGICYEGIDRLPLARYGTNGAQC